jgi:hypothetical protein
MCSREPTRPPRAVLTLMPSPCVTWFEFDLHHRVAPSHDRAIADDPLSTRKVVTRFSRRPECSQSVFSSRICAESMERLWSLAGATSGNRWQIGRPRKRRKQAKTVATGCDQLPQNLDGKEGVDGSSPSEGLHERPANGYVMLPAMARFGFFAGTRRVHFGLADTRGHTRRRATQAWGRAPHTGL